MRCRSQGDIQFGPADYSKREKCRGIKMQRVLPSRNVCIAYHGMTIPLPAHSLCGAYRNPVQADNPFTGGSTVKAEDRVKDSGYKSQVTSSSEVSTYSGSVTTSPGLVETCSSSGRNGDRTHREMGQLVTSDHDAEMPKLSGGATRRPLPPTAPVIDSTAVSSSSLPKSPSVVVNRPIPKKEWVHVGRGKALQQLVSQISSSSIGRGRTTPTSGLSTSSGTVSSVHRPVGTERYRHAAAVPGIEVAEEEDAHSSCASLLSPASRSGSTHLQPADGTADTCTSDCRPSTVERSDAVTTAEENSHSCTGRTKAPSETAAEFNTNAVIPSTTHHDQPPLSPGNAEKLVHDQPLLSPGNAEKLVHDQPLLSPGNTEKLVHDRDQPPLSPGNTEKLVHGSAGKKAPFSSRKAKVSLAIQFKGTFALQSVPGTGTANDCHKPTLLKPGDFLSPPAAAIAKQTVETKELRDVKPEEMAVQSSKEIVTKSSQGDGEAKEHEARDSGAVFMHISGDSDFARSKSETECGNNTRMVEGETRSSALQSRHRKQLVTSPESSEDELEGGELGWGKLGRSAGEIEKSIAVYQRNAHRNQMELRRVQQRNRATEEMLAADLAEQCVQDEGEEAIQYYITPERETSIDRVLELQFQFANFSQATERRYGGTLEDYSARPDHSKLTDMELKLEMESLEADDQLTLAKKEALLLQAKSELFD